MDLCYQTVDVQNALRMSEIRVGYSIGDYDKIGDVVYPLNADGSRIHVLDMAFGEISDNVVVLGSYMIVTSMLQLYKNNEILQLEFELFCDALLREGENDLFKRVGINFSCKNRRLGDKILSMIEESKLVFDEVVMEFPGDMQIMSHPILSKYYIDEVHGDNISWFIFDKVKEDYLDMTVLDMMLIPGELYYRFSDLFTSTNNDPERFVYAYELVTGNIDPYLKGYDGFRVTSKTRLTGIDELAPKIRRVMGEFTVITRKGIVDAMSVKYHYKRFKSRIFKNNGDYYILIHGFVSPNITPDSLDHLIRKDILNNLKTCKNDEDLVSLDKFEKLDLLELLHIVPHKEEGLIFCFSDEYNLDTNPYTRRALNKDDITIHYHNIFNM